MFVIRYLKLYLNNKYKIVLGDFSGMWWYGEEV